MVRAKRVAVQRARSLTHTYVYRSFRAAGQTNLLTWTNATWNTSDYSYPLGQPFNATMIGYGPSGFTGGDVMLGTCKWHLE